MKNLFFQLFIVSLLLFGCEDDIVPPPDVEYFTDITYEVTSTGAELTPDITYGSWITLTLTIQTHCFGKNLGQKMLHCLGLKL